MKNDCATENMHIWEHSNGSPMPTGQLSEKYDVCIWCGARVKCRH